MYRFIDQSPDRLTGGAHFLWWAMRGWAICMRRNRCPAASLAISFCRMDMREVLADFNELMLTLHHRGQRLLKLDDRDEATINEVEAVMLAVWADVAEGELERARAALGLMVLETKVDEIMARLGRVAAHMVAIEFPPNRVLEPDPGRL